MVINLSGRSFVVLLCNNAHNLNRMIKTPEHEIRPNDSRLMENSDDAVTL